MSDEPIPKSAFTTHTWVVATLRGSLPDEVGSPTQEGRRGLPPLDVDRRDVL
jgi:hypothetical protein